MSGRRLRSVHVVVGGVYALTITGLDDDATPVELVARCLRCRQELTRRRYDVAGVALAALGARVQVDAELDALRGLAHACGERN